MIYLGTILWSMGYVEEREASANKKGPNDTRCIIWARFCHWACLLSLALVALLLLMVVDGEGGDMAVKERNLKFKNCFKSFPTLNHVTYSSSSFFSSCSTNRTYNTEQKQQHHVHTPHTTHHHIHDPTPRTMDGGLSGLPLLLKQGALGKRFFFFILFLGLTKVLLYI